MLHKLTIALAIIAAATTVWAQEETNFDNSLSYVDEITNPVTGWLPEGMIPTIPTAPLAPDNTVSEVFMSAEMKMMMMQSMMMANPWSLREMISMMVAKKKVAEDLTIEDVIESMDLRANLLNMKKVGHNTPWKVIEATTGEPTPKIEMLSYCDIPTMREIVDYVPEFSVFVPCRISIVEDAAGDLWIMTLDWDIRWLDYAPNPNKIPAELREKAIMVRENLESIMEAGANGDL